MEIITLQEYTDQYVSLYEGEIRNLPNDLAMRLINKGVAAQHDKDVLSRVTSDDNGKILSVVNGKPAFVENSGSGGGGIISVTVDDSGANITAREVITALAAGTPVFYIDGEEGNYGGLFLFSYWQYADDVYSFWSAGHTSEDPAEFTAASLDDRLAWA